MKQMLQPLTGNMLVLLYFMPLNRQKIVIYITCIEFRS